MSKTQAQIFEEHNVTSPTGNSAPPNSGKDYCQCAPCQGEVGVRGIAPVAPASYSQGEVDDRIAKAVAAAMASLQASKPAASA